MIQLRNASQVRNRAFPYTDSLVTFLWVRNSDDTYIPDVRQAKSIAEKRRLVEEFDGKVHPYRGVLLAAWPGRVTQDVFVLDDLEAVKRALGIGEVTVTLQRDVLEQASNALRQRGRFAAQGAIDRALQPQGRLSVRHPGAQRIPRSDPWEFRS